MLAQVKTVAVISDTHLPKGARRISERALELIRSSDLLIHAGDFSTASVLEEIEAIGPPLLAVHGNVDDPVVRGRLPAEAEIEFKGSRIAVIHDAGPREVWPENVWPCMMPPVCATVCE
jgi:hypothetical protein